MISNRGINQYVTQEMNRSLLIKSLRREGTCSRAHLAALTGLKQATVTNIMKDFLNWGLVTEVGFLNGSKGRRSIGIAINTERYRVIGVRLARNHYSVGTFDLTGRQLTKKRTEISSREGAGAEEILKRIAEEICLLRIKHGKESVLAAGMAVPGPFIAKKNKIALITGADIWRDVDLKAFFDKEVEIPVFLEHNANAGAYAHMWELKEAYHDDILVYIAAGQGIGAGIVMNGTIYEGAQGTSGEIGHMTIDRNGKPCPCGNRGCLERYASSMELMKSVYGESRRDEDFEDLIKRIRGGDKYCLERYRLACESLGIGIITLVNVINPDRIIIGDDMVRPDSKLMETVIRETVKKGVLPDVWSGLTLSVSHYKGDPILTGAAIVAIDRIFDSPGRFSKIPPITR